MDIATTITSTLSTSTVVPLDRSSVLWVLIVGIIVAFFLAAGLGANDVSNTYGTSVGSGVVTIFQAYILATIFITMGAILVGWQVTDMMRKGVVDVAEYKNAPHELMLGQLAVLGGTTIWLSITTALSLPVSTTHAVVGSTLGFSLVLRGTEGVDWGEIHKIVASWFLSPAISGAITLMLYLLVDFAVLRRNHPFDCGLRSLPYFYFFVISFNVFMATWDGSRLLHFDKIPLWGCLVLAVGIGLIAALLVHFVLKPRLRRKIRESTFDVEAIQNPPTKTKLCEADYSECSKDSGVVERYLITEVKHFMKWFLPDKDRVDDEKTIQLFGSIQLFTACFAGFAIGANDVGNAIAPVASLVDIYMNQNAEQNSQVPIYVLLYGVVGICAGMYTFGYRIIKTVGTEVSKINPATGFTIEFGAALTTLVASKFGLPMSTTQCLVGSVVLVSCVRPGEGVKWKVFRDIVIAWISTVPMSTAISAGIMFLLKFTL